MPVLDSFDFEDARIELAIDEILLYCKGMVDRKGQSLFADVGRGWSYPEGTPRYNQVPQLRVWHDRDEIESKTNDFVCEEGEYLISFFLYYYATGDKDIQKQKSNFVHHFLKHMRAPDVNDDPAKFFDPQEFEFVTPQTVVVDHTSPFKRIDSMAPYRPHPWYVTRVDIKIYIDNLGW